MIILDKEGSLGIPMSMPIQSPGADTYRPAKLPYIAGFLSSWKLYISRKVFAGGETYPIWHYMRYNAGNTETITGEDLRHMETSELELVDQFYWISISLASIGVELTDRSAI